LKIKNLTIKNFKAFLGEYEFDFCDEKGNAKNILIYGENGSGKSSLYWALYHIFNSYEYKSLAMLDIDHFKKINDTYGHQSGDKVLKHLANLMTSIVRKSDIVMRYGGEEFLIFMPNTTKEEAYIVLQKIRSALTPCNNIKYTFSAGIADEGETLAEMIKLADEKLYKAKREGRNKVII